MNFENPSFEAEKPEAEQEKELTSEYAKELEADRLSRFAKLGGKAKAMAGAFMLMTAIGCTEKAAPSASQGFEGGYGRPAQESVGIKTHRETRVFRGYGIETKQEVEVDDQGNVVRTLNMETPYGGNR